MRRRATFDPGCFDLAGAFLSDNKDATENHQWDLADAIQKRIEDWIEYESGLKDTHSEKTDLLPGARRGK